MSGRKTLAIMGLLLLAGAAAWILSRPAPSGAVLAPPPEWDPLTPILRELGAPEPGARVEGGRHANDCGDPALAQPLLDALERATASAADARLPAGHREAERRVRITVAAALCRLEGPAGAAHTAAFLTDDDPMVRRAAILTAGRRGVRPPAAVMRALLADTHPEVQLEAAVAAGRLQMTDVADAVHAGAAAGPAAPRMLLAAAQLGGPGATELIAAALRDPARAVPAGEAAVVAGAPLIPALSRALEQGDERIRQVAADALRRIGGPEVLPPMLAAIADAAPRVRRLASELLAAEAGPAHRPAVLQALQHEQDWAVVRDLARALQRVAEPGDTAVIAATARRAPDHALADLMAALGRCGGPEALAAITELAARDTDEARRGLAEAGGVRFDAALVPAITPLLRHGQYTVQLAALRAVARAGADAPEAWRAACAELVASKVKPVRLAAAAALAGIDPARAAEAVLAHTATPDVAVAAGAWECLPQLQGDAGRAAVRAALEQGVRDNVAARFGADAAVALALPDAGPRLAALLRRPADAPELDKLARHAVARAFGRLAGPAELPALLPLLLHDDLAARRLAAESCFRILGAGDDALRHADLQPVRLPYWARRWWEANAGRPPEAWSRPDPPAVPTL